MSQNPYATYGNTTDLVPQGRTSVMAILSLVCSLICCIPGLGALAAIFGGVALLRISGSNGRRTGVGLAIAGIVIGLIVSFGWVVVTITTFQGLKQFVKIAQPVLDSVNASDPKALRAALDPALSAQITDADWAEFSSKVSAELGVLESPSNPITFFAGYKEAGPLIDKHKSSRNEIPIPLKGSKGMGVLLIEMPRNGKQNPGNVNDVFLGQAINVGVILPSGTTVYLVDPDRLLSPPTSPRPLPPAPPAPPAAPGTPKPDGV